jgi:hypothetical protein
MTLSAILPENPSKLLATYNTVSMPGFPTLITCRRVITSTHACRADYYRKSFKITDGKCWETFFVSKRSMFRVEPSVGRMNLIVNACITEDVVKNLDPVLDTILRTLSHARR